MPSSNYEMKKSAPRQGNNCNSSTSDSQFRISFHLVMLHLSFVVSANSIFIFNWRYVIPGQAVGQGVMSAATDQYMNNDRN